MSGTTGIEWTETTWNPTRGCSRTIADGAAQSGCGDGTGGGCYAETMAGRIVRMGKGKPTPYDDLVRPTANGYRWTGKVVLDAKKLAEPLSWRKPKMVFVDSMSDLFHESLPDSAIDQVVAVMIVQALHETRGGHTMQTLTKRAARMRAYFTDPATLRRVAVAAGRLMEDSDNWHDAIAYRKEGLVHPLLWWGVSVENQAAADERIPDLLATPAAVRFISAEPLLGPVDMRGVERGNSWSGGDWLRSFRFEKEHDDGRREVLDERKSRIDWVIVGCESGSGARECKVEWLRSLRDQCAAAAVPFFLKQARGATTLGNGMTDGAAVMTKGPGSHRKRGGIIGLPYLDGVQHAAMPVRA